MKILSIINNMNLTEGGPPEVLRNQIEVINKDKKIIDCLSLSAISYKFCFKIIFLSQKKKKFINFLKKFDLIHFHEIWNIKTILFVHYSNKVGIKHFYVGHGYLDQWSINEKFIKKKLFIIMFLQRCYRSAAASFFSTKEELLDAQRNISTQDNFIIPNGVNLRRFQKKVLNKKKFGKKKIVYFGRIHKKKGIDILLEAINALPSNFFEKFQFEITGPGEKKYVNFIKKKIESLNLNKKVVLNKPIFRESKIKYLSSADVFILPSFEEGDSIALKEAMASGLPVIISEQCRLNIVEEFSAGFIIQTKTESIVKALMSLLDSNLEKMGANARKLMEQKYNNEVCSKRLLDIYVDIKTGSKNSLDWIDDE
mgnify:CR=1 FL=1|jgi:glycosyltransferase involved in cell wall biosynthesis